MKEYVSPSRETQFVQIPMWVMHRKELTLAAKAVFGRIRFHCWYDTHTRVTAQRLSADLGVDEKTVRRAVTKLEEVGLIEVRQIGLNQPNEYWLLRHPWMAELPPEELQNPETWAAQGDVQSGVDKMSTPAWDEDPPGQNVQSELGKMSTPSLPVRRTEEKDTSRAARRAKKALKSKESSWQPKEGEDYGEAVPRRRRGEPSPGAQADNVTQLHKGTSAVGLADEFYRRLREVRPVSALTLGRTTLIRHIRDWVAAGWDPLVIQKMITVYFTRTQQVKSAKDPIRRFIFERAELYDTALQKLGEQSVTGYTWEPDEDTAPVVDGQEWGLG